ncbi:MAG TPA: FecR family protein [Pyrinomonadaceae bacterium]|jgi:hypothetical protein
MRKARITLSPALFVAALILSFPLTGNTQNREKFVISARAGGVNAVTGRATLRPHGNAEWRLLTIKEDLETGDLVRTGVDGRVEMLLNPGSYLRIGEDSEFELADNSLENLELHLIKGTAIVEVTGADDEDLLIGITTPHTRMSIVRRGLYRVNVVPNDATELIVRKGRVMLEDSHTKIKGGNKVVFSSGSFSVAKLEKSDKEVDTLDGWSKERAQFLAKANSQIPGRTMNTFATSFGNDWSYFSPFRRSGIWLFSLSSNCYTFIPYFGGWGSPYGGGYSRSFFPFGVGYWNGRPVFGGRVNPVNGYPARSSGSGSSNGPVRSSGSGSSTGPARSSGSGSSVGPRPSPPSAPRSPMGGGRGKDLVP